jgi:hypothetical protein
MTLDHTDEEKVSLAWLPRDTLEECPLPALAGAGAAGASTDIIENR